MNYLLIKVNDEMFRIPVEGEIANAWHTDEDMQDDEIKYAVKEES